MILWCKSCAALIGLREPFTDWKVDRTTTLCTSCMVAKAEEENINLDDSAVYDSLKPKETDLPTLDS